MTEPDARRSCAVWLLALLLGVPLFASMGLAAFAFVALGGLSTRHRAAEDRAVDELVPAARRAAVHPDGQHHELGRHHRPHLHLRDGAASAGCAAGSATPTSSASVIFAGMSGSAVADAGGVGTLEIKAMRNAGYDAETAAAITAASATIGPIIPPSLPMVIYGVSADVSIGGLFLAGVIPGLLMALALMVMVARSSRAGGTCRAIRSPASASSGTRFGRAFWALMTPVILFGGMIGGIFTPTEAAAVATVYALFLGLVRLSRLRPAATCRSSSSRPRRRPASCWRW